MSLYFFEDIHAFPCVITYSWQQNQPHKSWVSPWLVFADNLRAKPEPVLDEARKITTEFPVIGFTQTYLFNWV